jgi:hypothetical protein
MGYRYYRYTIDGALSQDARRSLGETGGVIVRIDKRGGATEVTVAVSDDGQPAAESSLGAGSVVREEDVLTFGG